ncbi:MAG: T9SS type A sorting domain-containing protein [Bacteroidetes bacterium]|nr:MAG: T9SS type A sorting domain-containing protein [Bacteroidota bacterium]
MNLFGEFMLSAEIKMNFNTSFHMKKKFFFLLAGLLVAGFSMAQIVFDNNNTAGTHVLGSKAGDYVWRVFAFQHTGSGYTGSVELTHQNFAPQDLAFQSATIYINSSQIVFGQSFDPLQDPTTNTTPYGLSFFGGLSETETLNSNMQGNFDPSSSFQSTQTSSSLTLTNNQYIYIVEKYLLYDCYSGSPTNLNSDLSVSFTGPNGGFPNTPSGDIYIEPIRPNWTITTSNSDVFPGIPLYETQIADDGDCTSTSGKQVAKKTRYELNTTSLTDPFFTLLINSEITDRAALLEIDPDDFRLSFGLDTDNDGQVDLEAIHVTISELYNGNILNNVLSEREGVSGMQTASATAIPASPAPITNPGTLLQDELAYNTTTWTKYSNTVSYVPSVAESASSTNNAILSRIRINFSNLFIPNPNSAVNTEVNTADNYSMYIGSATNRQDAFITIYPGSWIEVEYKGTLVPQENFHSDWSNLQETVPIINNHSLNLYGFDHCEQPYQSQFGYGVNGAYGAIQSTFANSPNPSILVGNADHDPDTWDGEGTTLEFDLQDVRRFFDGLINLTDLAAIHYDYQCSFIEFELELERGLGLPCPNVADNSITYLGGCNNFSFGNTGTSYLDAAGNNCSSVSASEVFWLDLGQGHIVRADALSIEPLHGNCSDGQVWRVRLPMNQFLVPGINLLQTATLYCDVQAYCPSAEPGPNYQLRSYLIPGRCNGTNQYITPVEDESGNFLYNSSSCNGSCLSSSCTNDRILVGSSANNILITCPGCITPGAIVFPNAVPHERHHDFLGLEDTNDDGIRDDLTGNTIANPNDVNLNVLRQGDVMHAAFSLRYFDGDQLDLDPNGDDHFNLSHLSNPIQNVCNNGTPPALSLATYVLDVSANDATEGLKFKELFCPLIADASPGGTVIQANDDLLQNNGLSIYNNLISSYPSTVTVMVNGVPNGAPISISQNNMVWIDDATLRFVFAPEDLNLPAGTVFNSSIELVFDLNYITDVDKKTVIWTDVAAQNNMSVDFAYFAYTTDLDKTAMLANGGTTSFPVMVNHASEYCDIASGQTWWCEQGAGSVSIAPYFEERHMERIRWSEFAGERARINRLITDADALSECVEAGPLNVFSAGTWTRNGLNAIDINNRNYFPHEVRPPALPDHIDLYLPEPFTAEAIYINNVSVLRQAAYQAGTSQGRGFQAIIPQSLWSQYGIQVTAGHVIPEDFMPRYSTSFQCKGSTSCDPWPINNTTGASDDPIFDLSTPQPMHTRVRIPIEMVYDPNHFTNTSSTVALHTNDLPGAVNNKWPVFISDERLDLQCAILYGMPACTSPSADPNVHEPYGQLTQRGETELFRENNDLIYYDGSYSSMLHYFHFDEYLTLHPVNETSPGNGDYDLDATAYNGLPLFHPIYQSRLLIPNVIASNPPVNPANPALISTDWNIPDLKNHILDFNSYPNNTSTATQLRDQFEGVVPNSIRPEAWGFDLLSTRPAMAHMYFDQRSNLDISAIGNQIISVDPTTGEFTIEFEVRNKDLEQQSAISGPAQFFEDQGHAVFDDFLNDPNTNFGAGPYAGHLAYVDASRAENYNEDVDHLYFYLKPIQGSGSVPTLINMFEDITIQEVRSQQGTQVSISDFSSLNVQAAHSDGTPRLFDSYDIMGARTDGFNVTEQSSAITIRGKFNCSRQEVQDWLQQGGSTGSTIAFPFDVVLNYNCTPNLETWNSDNAADFIPGGHPGELTLQQAAASRCQNDLLESFEFQANQLGYTVTLDDISTDPCNPVFSVTTNNILNGTIYLDELNLTSTNPGISAPMISDPNWVLNNTDLSTPGEVSWSYGYVGNGEIPGGQNLSFELNFAGGTCISAGFNLSAEVLVRSYCADCQSAGSSCRLTPVSANAMFNYSIGTTLLDFSNYDPYSSGICAELQTGNLLLLNLSSIVDQVDYAGSYTGYDYTFHVSLGQPGLTEQYSVTWNTANASTFFAQATIDLSSTNLDLCQDINITIEEVSTSYSCGATSCPDIVQNVGASCVVSTGGPVISGIVTDVVCYGAQNGGVTINVTGGETPYQYEWTGGTLSAPVFTTNLTGVGAGVYTVTVTDDRSCSSSEVFNVIEPANDMWLNVLSHNHITCHNDNDGAFDVEAINGTAPYQYSIDGGQTFNSTGSFSNLTGGYYSVLIRDANACEAAPVSIVISNPDPINVAIANLSDATCGLSNGMVDLDASGGTGQLYFNLIGSGQPTNTSGEFFNLAPGSYTVQVHDGNACTTDFIFAIGQGPAVSFQGNIQEILCSGDLGGIDITVQSGQAPFSFEWTGDLLSPVNTEDLFGVGAGKYVLTVTDNNGCSATQTFVLSEPNALSISYQLNEVSCFGDENGAIDITVSGGTGPYSYSWTGGSLMSPVNMEDIDNLSSGTYTIVVLDDNNCSLTENIFLTEPLELIVQTINTPPACHDGNDGTIEFNVTNGTGPFTFFIDRSNVGTSVSPSYTVSGLSAGQHEGFVLDANGCGVDVDAGLVPHPEINTTYEVNHIECAGTVTGGFRFEIEGGVGPYTTSFPGVWQNQNIFYSAALAAGTYDVEVCDAVGCCRILSIQINEPGIPLSGFFSPVFDACNSGQYGSATINAFGGTAPYTYQWDENACSTTKPTALHLLAGNYSVTITDANACTSIQTVTIGSGPTMDWPRILDAQKLSAGSQAITIHDIATDNAGGVYIAGSYDSPTDFVGTGLNLSSNNNVNGFVAKYSDCGIEWVNNYTSLAGTLVDNVVDEVFGIEVTNHCDRAVYIVGVKEGSGRAHNKGKVLPGYQSSDKAFIERLDAIDGSSIWYREEMVEEGSMGLDVAIHQDGIYMLGVFKDRISFVGNYDPDEVTSLFNVYAQENQLFLAKFEENNGTPVWLKPTDILTRGTYNWDDERSTKFAALESDGKSLYVATQSNLAKFDPDYGKTWQGEIHSSVGNNSVKLTTSVDLHHQNGDLYYTSSHNVSNAVYEDPNGVNSYLGSNPSGNAQTAYMMSIDPITGALEWSKSSENQTSNYRSRGSGLTGDGNNVYWTGVSFAPSTGSQLNSVELTGFNPVTGNGAAEGFVASYTSSGTPVWLLLSEGQVPSANQNSSSTLVMTERIAFDQSTDFLYTAGILTHEIVNVNNPNNPNLPITDLASEPEYDYGLYYDGTNDAFVSRLDNTGTWRFAPPNDEREEFVTDEFRMFVQPNPNNGAFLIRLTGELEDNAQIEIFDLYGQLVVQRDVRTHEVMIDLNQAASGVYLIRFTDGNKMIQERIVIQHN